MRRWFRDHKVIHEFNGEAIECPTLRVDIVDGSRNPVMEAILKRHKGMPPLEAVAELKYVAAVSPTREYLRKQQDATDLAGLVLHLDFDEKAFLGMLVGPYADEVQRATRFVDDVRGHRNTVL